MAATTDPQVTFPCSVNSVPFYPATSMRRAVDAAVNFGQASYIDSLLKWQSKLPYLNKRLFNDQITVQIKTQLNDPTYIYNSSITPGFLTCDYLNPAKLEVCVATFNPDGSGFPVPGEVVAAFSGLNPSYSALPIGGDFWGVISPTYDTYTDPVTQYTQRLATYMWSFNFDDYLDPDNDSGIYFLKFTNYYSSPRSQTQIFYSEPILVYGTDARQYFDRTLLFEGNNYIDKSDIIIHGWALADGRVPVFRARVEADILEYEPKGIYLAFLQQNWLQNNTYTQSWKTWTLNIGSIEGGIPATMFEIITKFLELDRLTINNQYYIYDSGAGGSTNPNVAWKMKKPRVKQLLSGTLPIRYKYENQFFAPSMSVYDKIFSEEFDDVFS